MKDIEIQAGARVPITLELQPPFEISGRVVAGPSAPSGFRVDQTKLFLTPGEMVPNLNGIFSGSASAQIGADGEFIFRNLMPGVHYLLGGETVNLIARYGDRNADEPIVYEKGSKRLDVEIDFRVGQVEQVEVTVMDQGKPQSGVRTLLAGTNGGPYKSQVSDNQGRVVFSSIWPGDYDLLAIEDLRTDSWLTRSFWNEFGSRARRIHVDKAAQANATIPLIKLDRGLIGK
jgi:hypothetical protein